MLTSFINKIYPINPICLRVDIATNFFKSGSTTAITPAKKDNKTVARQKNKDKLVFISILLKNLEIMYNPAVTKVEEWTNAETGVGAAMAAGSHAEKGI